MKSVTGISLITFCCVGYLGLSAQGRPQPVVSTLKPGLVVEQVGKNSESVKAGIQPGDVLLRWSREGAYGEIQSPFDLTTIEFEQDPRGTVTLEGLRAQEKKSWTMGPDFWVIQVRPSFSESLLAIYSEGAGLATASKREQAAERWHVLANNEQTASPVWLRPWLFFQIAEMHAESRQWKDSDAAYQEALQSAANAGPEVRAHLYRAWAGTYLKRSDWQNAERRYQESIAENKKLGPESLIIAANLEDLGTVCRLRGDPAKADEYYLQSLELRKKLAPGSLDHAHSLNTLGIQAFRRGDLDTADEYHHQALEIRQKVAPGGLSVASSLGNLGNVARRRGDLDKAEEYYRQALEIQQRLVPVSLDVAAALNNLGVVVWQRGDLTRADDYWLQALEIRQRLAPGSLDVASSFSNLGLTADQRGNWDKAEKYYRQALEIQQKLAPSSLDAAYSLNNLGDVARERDDLVKADEYYRQALEIKQKAAPGGLDVASTLSSLGEVALQRRNLGKAEDYCRQASEIREKLSPGSLDVAAGLKNLGEVAFRRADFSKAEEHFRLALEIRETRAPGSLYVADSLDSLGKIAFQRGDLTKAEEEYRRASAIRSELAPESKEQAESLASLARVIQRKGELGTAARFYEQALHALESQTAQWGAREEVRADFRAQHQRIYRDYIDLLITQSKPTLAFHVLERSRGQTLLEALAASSIDIHKDADPRLLEKERSLEADINAKSNRRVQLLVEKQSGERIRAVEKEISTLSAECQDVKAQIRSRSPEYAALIKPQPLTAQEVQDQLLDSETLLLEYSLGEERSHVFVVSAHSVKVLGLPKRAVIEQQTQRVYDLLTERNRRKKGETYAAKAARIARAEAEYPAAIARLSKTILGPAARQLTRKRLLIVGDGTLYYVPFAALPVSLPGKAAVLLSSEHEIITLPSASVLAALRRERMSRKPGTKTIAVLADAVFDRGDIRVKAVEVSQQAESEKRREQTETEDSRRLANLTRSAADVGWDQERRGEVVLPRLPFSRQEANAIAAIAPAGQCFRALDFNASRNTAVSPALAHYRIVHFATHAFLNSEHPELSGLVLSLVDEQGKPQSGFVDLQDIYNLELRADLVVLSACETALGKRIEGEGLVGLTRGFMYAGAKGVVASLWRIDDRPTAELMRLFYKAMLGKGMRPAAALRAAQLDMRNEKRWSSPYFWAAFQLQGEWK